VVTNILEELVLIFRAEDGSSRFLQDVGSHLPNYTGTKSRP
jgi:hypothetical protein